MEMKFQDLLTAIGASVQQARQVIEDSAVELYFQGYEKKEGDPPVYAPIQRQIQLPGSGSSHSGKIVGVPITTLYHHNAMSLDSVDVKLKFLPSERDGDLWIEVKPRQETETAEFPYSELSLSFKSQASPEGMARVDGNFIKILP